MRILVIFTGGTIGCSPPDSNAVLNTTEHENNNNDWKSYYLLTLFKETSKSINRDKVSFDVIKPLNILSENMTISKWSVLAGALQKIDFSLYQGIVITHGTDTLAYTASFLGILLSGINLPIVLVSANKNLYDPRTNGNQNFEAAVDFICTSDSVGVYAAYSYERDKTIIYLGTRIKQSDAYVDRYESVDGIDYGFIKNNRFMKTCNINPTPYCGNSILTGLKDLKSYVMLIQPYTGLDYSLILLDKKKTKAILHTVYHSFTACISNDTDVSQLIDNDNTSSILYLDKVCKDNDILLYAAPFSKSLLNGGERYESTNAMLNGNINFMCGHSAECAYAKLLIAVNLYTETQQIKDFVSKTIFCENAENTY